MHITPSSLARLTPRLRAAGCVFAEDEAALLVEAAADQRELDALSARRIAGEPLEHVLGWVAFLGARYAVAPGVFVPRRSTELLVTTAAAVVAEGNVALDLCCGSGAIGAALAAAVPGLEVWASDIDPAAVAVARENLPPDRVVEGDFFDGLPHRLRRTISLIVCNAPYVPTDAIEFMPVDAREHEPLRALDGGADGLDLHRRLAREAGDWLATSGVVIVEAGDAQAPRSAAVFGSAGFSARIVHDDERGATAVIASLR